MAWTMMCTPATGSSSETPSTPNSRFPRGARVRPLCVRHGIMLTEKEIGMATTLSKDTRLFVRCKSNQKQLIERAASALGMSVSDFILGTVIERSSETVQRHNRIKISAAAFEQLQDLMMSDPEPSPALIANLRRYKQATDSGELTVED